MKIAVCVHLYHHDMWEEIKEYLNNIDHPYKLYVNICGNILFQLFYKTSVKFLLLTLEKYIIKFYIEVNFKKD